ncbi:helix-turn-helix domain-containing protein [Stieleria sp. TO1_6]|uniref:helix-turn-helix transcriptional regulator n=1 Tax=Stieleria tagensis TaxID=2956795 RepID=UPI00209B5862|nr:helix-turn-helix domain-containing protein [Stieleria tagensis]MCO8125071.1 helix-turn-helix domain-containing protein [Stieleria tagensis]
MSRSPWVTAAELCERLNVTDKQLGRMVASGKFPKPLRVGINRRVWSRNVLDAYFDLQAIQQIRELRQNHQDA